MAAARHLPKAYGEIVNFSGLAPIEPGFDELGFPRLVDKLQRTGTLDLKITKVPEERWKTKHYTPFRAWFLSQTGPVHALMQPDVEIGLVTTQNIDPKYPGEERLYRIKTCLEIEGTAVFPAFDENYEVALHAPQITLHAPTNERRPQNVVRIVEDRR